MSSADDTPDDTDQTPSPDSPSGPRLSPALIATLITIPVMVIVGFITFAALKADQDESTPVDGYAAASTVDDQCAQFLAGLPGSFEGFGSKSVDGDRAIWSADEGDPIVVRCGVDRPSGLAPDSRLQAVNNVQWFITDTEEGRGQAYVCVDHRPYVALWVPVSAGNASITAVSTAIGSTLSPGPLDFG
ncbi:DUF3515 domain-containing protein [Gordonia desulfuricans]|nr:DUF3515 domain-containing protein [Gordonia desulfuricans]